MMWKCHETGWLIFILGLFLITNQCESRAVNISNTWTLPQDGFTVFYRFFRDKISWFEADAVCQFHHANLATVDNGHQFDAARDFLKILDVTDTVWIGLMRPQNSERFSWANSKPLASASGYWAESLPLIESPLCAVIDPVRDFRWHALRCGGPETASFLCEMNVPSWAEECNLRGIPSLTIQYMADSGAVELTKDCGEDGTKHQICKGKQDREKLVKELICRNEKAIIISENSLTSTDLAGTHEKTLEIINNIPSDNTEDNNISFHTKKQEEILEKQEQRNPIEKIIEQYNIEDMMQADQAHEQYQEIIPKPVKKQSKKAKSFEKKDKSFKKMKKSKSKSNPQEEMMMGDQPMPDIEQVQEPLPHIKKSLPQDLKHHDVTEMPELITATEQEQTSTSEIKHSDDMEISTTILLSETTENIQTSSILTTLPTIDTKTATIGHPMHPQQPRATLSPIPVDDGSHSSQHMKETNDNHFIPPMLLVKSHYTSTKPHLDEQTNGNLLNEKTEITTQHFEIPSKISETTSEISIGLSTKDVNILTPSNSTTIITTSIIENNNNQQITTKLPEKISSTTFEPPSTEHQIVEIKIGNSDNPTTFSITTRPVIGETGHSSTTQMNQIEQTKTSEEVTKIHHENEFPLNINNINNINNITNNHDISNIMSSEQNDSKENHSKETNIFSNEENFQPYKPNRRRVLTKPEEKTYLKKILG